MKKLSVLLAVLFLARNSFAASSGSSGMAGNVFSESRVFVTQTQLASQPDDINALVSGDSVGGISKINGFGLEGNFNVGGFMKAGLRAGGNWAQQTSSISTNTNSFLDIQQGYGGAIVRFPIIRTNPVLFDIFGEGGLTVTHIDVSTQSNGQGTFSKSFSPYERAGASLALGWSSFYIFGEAGYKWQNIDTMSYSGTLTTSISSINLSGTYVAVGFIVTGSPAAKGKSN